MEDSAASGASESEAARDAGPPATAVKEKPKRKTEWVKILLFLALLGCVGWFGRTYFDLGYKIKMIADMYYGQGVGSDILPLSAPDEMTMASYEPRQVAWFTGAPFATWRLVAVQSLETQATNLGESGKWVDGAPEWEGVAERLARTATSDSEKLARTAAGKALLALPGLTESEGPKLLEYGARPGPIEGREPLLRAVARRAAKQKEPIQSALTKLAESGSVDERFMAVSVWSQEFSDSPDKAVGWLLALSKDGGDLGKLVESAGRLVRSNAAKVDELIAAGKNGETVAILGAYSGGSKIDRPERLRETALALIEHQDAKVSGAAFKCLLGDDSDGWNVFAKRVQAATPEIRTRLLTAALKSNQMPRNNFTFGKAEGDLVATWLTDNERQSENLGFKLFRRGFSLSQVEPLFRPNSGPNNEANAKYLEPYLTSSNANERWLAAQFFSYNANLTEAKLPQIKKIVREEIAQPLQQDDKDASLARARRLLEKVMKRFPADADFKKLLADVAAGEEARRNEPPPPTRGGAMGGRGGRGGRGGMPRPGPR